MSLQYDSQHIVFPQSFIRCYKGGSFTQEAVCLLTFGEVAPDIAEILSYLCDIQARIGPEMLT